MAPISQPPAPAGPSASSPGCARPWDRPGAAALVLAGLAAAGAAAYANSFSVPFFFDDRDSITNNPTIRHLWPPWGMLAPPSAGQSVAHRPLANASLALNYALGGLGVEGYHGFNLAIHVLAAFALYGVVRRTLLQPVLRDRYGGAAGPLAGLCALWWLVHPLLTESVTAVVERTESLMGLFYLATLYAAIRALGSPRPGRWRTAAVLFCAAGMATKEVMVTAPLMVSLYDRTFAAGSFRAAWRERRGFYLALALTWGLLAWLEIGGGGMTRGGTAGFSGRVAWWQYLDTQFYALVRYLRLSFWPHPLVFDYGTYLVGSAAVIVACGAIVIGLALATAIALWRRPVLGFAGAWFFAILAPTSSVVPVITQTMAERRMYLALPAVLVPLVLALYGRLRAWLLPVGLAVALAGIAGTLARNRDYHSARSIWENTVAHWPDGPRGHINLASALITDAATRDEAIRQLDLAIRLQPEFGQAHLDRGSALALMPGREAEAAAAFQRGLQLLPGSALGHSNYGQLLVRLPGRRAEGLTELREAIRLEPGLAEAHAALGEALAKQAGAESEALAQLEIARNLQPDSAEAQNNLGLVLYRAGRLPEALAAYAEALRLRPGYVPAHFNRGVALLDSGRPEQAAAELRQALDAEQHRGEVHLYLGDALAALKRSDEAADQYARAAKLLEAGDGAGWLGLANSLARQGQLGPAAAAFAAAAKAAPANPEPLFGLGNALAAEEQYPAAAAAYRRALALAPGLVDARHNLGNVLLLSGQVAAAVDEYREALRERPGDPALAESLRSALEIQRGEAPR